jgi:hypothetical protein
MSNRIRRRPAKDMSAAGGPAFNGAFGNAVTELRPTLRLSGVLWQSDFDLRLASPSFD